MLEFADILPISMFAVLGLMLFTGYPVAFVLAGLSLVFGGIAIATGLMVPIEYYNVLPRFWYGAAENLTLTAIPTFVLMGVTLERSGVAQDLLRGLNILLRRVPGGLAMSVAAMGTILAAMTGIIGASVVLMTVLALPTMLRQGYDHRLATGVIAASGTLGILIPPSIMLVIMADLLAVSVGNLFLAALMPGLTLSAFYLLYILTLSTINPKLAPPMRREDAPIDLTTTVIVLLKGFVPPAFLIMLIKVSIFGGWATPTEAGGVGAGGAMLLAIINRRINREVLTDIVQRTAMTVGMIFGIFLGASGFSYVFRALGGDDVVIHMIEQSGLGPWALLFVMMAIVFFLGFFLDWFEIILIALPVFIPIIALLDFSPHVPDFDKEYWFTILLAVNLQTSFLTPPFGFALFYMKGVTPPQVKLQSIYRGIIPFVLLQLAGLAATIAYPDLALWLPRYALD